MRVYPDSSFTGSGTATLEHKTQPVRELDAWESLEEVIQKTHIHTIRITTKRQLHEYFHLTPEVRKTVKILSNRKDLQDEARAWKAPDTGKQLRQILGGQQSRVLAKDLLLKLGQPAVMKWQLHNESLSSGQATAEFAQWILTARGRLQKGERVRAHIETLNGIAGNIRAFALLLNEFRDNDLLKVTGSDDIMPHIKVMLRDAVQLHNQKAQERRAQQAAARVSLPSMAPAQASRTQGLGATVKNKLKNWFSWNHQAA